MFGNGLYRPYIPKEGNLVDIKVGYTSFEVFEYCDLGTTNKFTKFLVSYSRIKKKAVSYKQGKFEFDYIPDKKFYGKRETLNGDVYWLFPISLYPLFLDILNDIGVPKDRINITLNRDLKFDKLDLRFNPEINLRDYQIDYIKGYMDIRSPIGLLDMATGTGKTVTGCKLIQLLNSKVLVLIKPVYIAKWIEDIKKYFPDIQDDDICVIQGYKNLETLFRVKKEDLKYKFYILSLVTASKYIESYEDNDLIYDTSEDLEPSNNILVGYDDGPLTITPDKFLNHIGCGVILSDEMHQHFHALYKCLIYFNPIKTIGLTATLISNERNMMNLYKVLLGEDGRISDKLQIKPYCNYETINYELPNMKKFKFNSSMGYSHAEFEKSIMIKPELLEFYLDMITNIVEEDFILTRKNGDKAIIYLSTIALCNIVKEHLEKVFSGISVDKYIGTDKYEKIMEADLCVTNVIKAGAALDIPNLTRVYMTIPFVSNQANLQTYGRLRKLNDRETKFVSLVCAGIDAHKAMERTRLIQLNDKILEKSSRYY